ncbi:glycosyltransferase, partial [Elusimicrobiota bacterium]
EPFQSDGAGAVPGYSVIVPFFNEKPWILARCVDSVLRQTLPAEEIFFVDDGSRDDACYKVVQELLQGRSNAHVIRFSENKNKRNAQAAAIRRIKSPVIVTLDSDTVLEEDAAAEGIKPFSDPTVQAVSGNVRALNAKTNLLTRLIDLRYCNAFRYERAAYSTVDAVICASGVFSLWRTSLLVDNLEDYLHQRFLGIPVIAGDDRRLSYYALREGKSVFQETASCETLVPESLGQFFKQQVRWNRSFIRETLHILASLRASMPAWWLALSELLLWLVFGVLIIFTFIVKPMVGGRILGLYYFGYISLMAYVRSVRYISEGFFVYLLSPVYALVHIFLLLPVRIYSLITIRNDSWGTRN